MTHLSATPGSTLLGLARCIWRLTIDLGSALIWEARKVAEDRRRCR